MNANGRKPKSSLRHFSRKSARAVKQSIVTLGDLVSAAYEVAGSTDSVAKLFSPLSPLQRMLGRRVVAT